MKRSASPPSLSHMVSTPATGVSYPAPLLVEFQVSYRPHTATRRSFRNTHVTVSYLARNPQSRLPTTALRNLPHLPWPHPPAFFLPQTPLVLAAQGAPKATAVSCPV